MKPLCRDCGEELVIRENRKDGSEFWGCPGYPACTYTQNEIKADPLDEEFEARIS